MNFSTLSIQNREGHARMLANNKRTLEELFFLVAAEVTRLKFLLETASRPAVRASSPRLLRFFFQTRRRERRSSLESRRIKS